jgi:hypothetical protein
MDHSTISALGYRFRVVVIDSRWTADESFAITLNTVSCSTITVPDPRTCLGMITHVRRPGRAGATHEGS